VGNQGHALLPLATSPGPAHKKGSKVRDDEDNKERKKMGENVLGPEDMKRATRTLSDVDKSHDFAVYAEFRRRASRSKSRS